MQTFSSTLNTGNNLLRNTTLMNNKSSDLNSGIEYDLSISKSEIADSMNFSKDPEKIVQKSSFEKGINSSYVDIENPFNLGTEVFETTNKYTTYFKEPITNVFGSTYANDKGDINAYAFNTIGTPSIFNPYYAIRTLGEVEGIPLLDSTTNDVKFIAVSNLKEIPDETSKTVTDTQEFIDNINDCSIKRLVEESKRPMGSPLGLARYKYSDFMYCKDLGKISNNYMITLRKFATPVRDNIFSRANFHDENNYDELAGDVGRLVTWFGTDDNKLEDIMKYSFRTTWKELEAKIDPKPSEEDDPARGPLGKVLNTLNPKYNESINKGVGRGMQFSKFNFNTNGGTYTNNPVVNGNTYDNNKVYTPKNTVQKTHIYEGKLEFEQEFTLTFNYTLRSYNGINPKTAFLDLLGNVLAVTYKDGTFWPGQQRLLGPPQNKVGWNKAKVFLDNTFEDGSLFVSKLISGDGLGDAAKGLFANIASNLNEAITGTALEGVANSVKGLLSGKTSLGDTVNSLLTAADASNIGQNLWGGLKNTLGRPAIYAFDSLLSGDAVGLWHVTIGNPLNPIAAFGNLIITNTEVQHYGPLGFDDFPTGLKVSITLKHATPRDMVDIGKMYTKGESALYIPVPGNSFDADEIQKTRHLKTNSNGKKVYELNESMLNKLNQNPSDQYKEYTGWYGDWHPQRIQANRDNIK